MRSTYQKFPFFIALVLAIFLAPAFAHATTYYVDNVGGLDTNNGTSSATAWATIAKVNASAFLPGDNVLFKDGDVWREQLTVPSSGATGTPITFSSYGSGAQPVISGANLVTSWSQVTPPAAQFNAPLSANTTPTAGSGSATFTRASSATYINSSTGYLTTVATNTPRFETVGGKASVLLEPAATNLFEYSDAVTNWPANLVTLGSPVVGPDGVTADAYPIIPTATTSGDFYVQQSDIIPSSITAGQPYVASVYAKPGVSNYINIQIVWLTNSYSYLGSSFADYNLASGTVTLSGGPTTVIAGVGPSVNGFHRITLEANAPAGAQQEQVSYNMETDGNGDASTGNGTSIFSYVTDAQFEQSPVATSYISTGSTTVARASEMGTLTFPTSGNFNAASGTAYLQWYPSVGESAVAAGTYGLLSVNGTSSNLLFYQNSAFIKSFDGTNTATAALTWASSTWYSLAVTWGNGHLTVYQNGTAGASTTFSGTFSPGAAISLLTGNAYPAHIANVQFWNTILTASQVANIGVSSATYSANETSTPSYVYVDSGTTPLTGQASVQGVDANPGSWYYSTSTDSLYVQLADSSDPSGHSIEAAIRSYGVYNGLGTANHIVLNNLEITRATQDCVYSILNNDWTISNNSIHNCGIRGILEEGSTTLASLLGSAANWTIENNTFGKIELPMPSGFNPSAISLWGVNSMAVENNYIDTGDAQGISLDTGGIGGAGAPNANLQISGNDLTGNYNGVAVGWLTTGNFFDNYIHDEGGFGFGISISTGTILSNNVIYNLDSPNSDLYNGFDISNGAVNGKIYNNTIVKVAAQSVTLENGADGPSNGWIIENNIFDCRSNLDVGGVGWHGCFYIASGISTSTLTFSNNVYSDLPSHLSMEFQSPGLTWLSLAQFESIVTDTNSQNVSDPGFVNNSTGELWLSPSSPAIDAGLNLGSTYQLALTPSSTWPSNVGTVNQNQLGAGWDVGAYGYIPVSNVVSSVPTVSVGAGYGGGGGSGTTTTTTQASSTTGAATTTITSTSSTSATSSAITTGMTLTQMQTLLASLEAQLQALEAQAAGGASSFEFGRNLVLWSTGLDVKTLQQYLIAQNKGLAAQKLKAHGTTYTFGLLTLNALVEFQSSVGIVPASGYFGPITRAWVNAHP